MTFATLTEAIDWTSLHWNEQRPVPLRIHSRDLEGVGLITGEGNCGKCLACTEGPADRGLGSHAFSNAMASALDGGPFGYATITLPDAPCYHPTLVRGDSPRACPECHGLGVKDHKTTRYYYPMGAALANLAAIAPDKIGRRHPHPYALVHVLVAAGWDWRLAARSLNRSEDAAEALFLIALRKLRSRYQEGPGTTRTSASWVDKSQAQRDAEAA